MACQSRGGATGSCIQVAGQNGGLTNTWLVLVAGMMLLPKKEWNKEQVSAAAW